MESPVPLARGRTRRALAFLRPHRGPIAAILCLTLGISAIAAFEPLKHVLDALGLQAVPPVIRELALLGCLAVSRESLSAIANWLTWRTRIRVHFSLMEATVGRR